ncbi:MMPL family transporter [Azospirillum rugosum]|uniref:Hopanoid biosynthesis associated RND transporter like protein HpnN n=1 Tax=Azospirillum rugosum TaxID=416170 RepID=A0ABS4SGJ7_9PROT|nr:MMPL family transporter [Azospirillum rugosum]MBP2291684.1 hopanoid biosynthesis associated RND transporter like protein HpnN [Azospirillum rugosum]MDQ0524504.1 hopanoid biosynthesis associated RND transporter like protein HpnN [Azospirillum rugosum]
MIDRIVERLVGACIRHALIVLFLALAAAGALGWTAATRLGMDTDVAKLIAADLPWRERELTFDRLFPQEVDLLAVVVDGQAPDLADHAATAIAERLRTRTDLFKTVRMPGSGPFFERNGILFLPTEEIRALTDRLIEAQPLIGVLAADPSARGLFGVLDRMLEGVERKQATMAQIAAPLDAVGAAVGAALQGRTEPVAWSTLLTGRDPAPEELRRFVLAQPILDFDELEAAAKPTGFIRDTVRQLGLTPDHGVRVRITGSVALNDEEFATVSEGAGESLALSAVLVLVILFLAVRSPRLIVPIMVTLVVGLVCTAGFAALAVGTLNPISVAFAVMFIGIAVDFGIQVCVRYREQRFNISEPDAAMRATGREVGRPLLLAAATTAAGFLAFVPTAYVGVSQLGLIAGAGMVIAVLLNLTLLPALLTLFHPSPEREHVGIAAARPLDRALLRHRRAVLAVAGLAALGSVALLTQLRFDFNPLNLQNPHTEAMSTMRDLMDSPRTSPFSIEVVTPNVKAAAELADRLSTLPEVGEVISVSGFVPEDQPAKLALLADAAQFIGPTLALAGTEPPPTTDDIRKAAAEVAARLVRVGAPERAEALQRLAKSDDATVQRAATAMTTGLKARLDGIAAILDAQPVTLDSLPPDLVRDYVAPDGRARVTVFPKGDSHDNATIVRFVDAVRAVAPQATGVAVTIQESGDTISAAFLRAAVLALVAVTVLLALALRRVRDVVLVVAPLVLALLLTMGLCVLVGLSLNYANIIALPLLLGIGVAFNIYFVVNWRAGHGEPLASPTARAVLFSALTTAAAFGTLALSHHPGTASMGLLLCIALGCTLLTAVFVLPALLGPVPTKQEG